VLLASVLIGVIVLIVQKVLKRRLPLLHGCNMKTHVDGQMHSLGIVAILIIAGVFFAPFIFEKLAGPPKTGPEFGDAFDAANALFTGLAFIGVLEIIVTPGTRAPQIFCHLTFNSAVGLSLPMRFLSF
jgi:hypothetical protein